MSIEALRREIISSAEKEKEKILNEAKAEAERIVEEANDKALKIIERKRSQIESQLKSRMEVSIAVRRLEGKRKVYEEIMSLIEMVRNETEKRLEQIRSSNEYLDIIVRFISRGVESLGTKKVKVYYSPLDKEFFEKNSDRIAKILKDKFGGELEISFLEFSERFSGGVIISDNTESTFYVSTFDGRMKNVFEEKLDMILNILKGGGVDEAG